MFSGSFVALITPMRRDGSVDLDAWSKLVEFHVGNGTAGLVVGGTTGESATLSDAELEQLVTRARDVGAGRIPVVAGAGTSSTATTVERVRRLCALNVDALLVVTPAYNRPPQDGLFRHFQAVNDASSVPIVLYNVPARTAVDLAPDTVARLAKLPRIAAIKEAVPSVDRIRDLVQGAPAGFIVLSGDDATACSALGAGAQGVISVTANVAPRLMSEMVAAALAGDAARAKELDSRLTGLHDALFVESNPIPAKWVLAQMGLADIGIRLPLTVLAAEHEPLLRRAMAAAGL